MRAYERLMNYVKVWTTSDLDSETVPSAGREFELARRLVEELKDIGIQETKLDDKCYIYSVIPATPGYEDKPAIGLIAHMDTAPDFGGKEVCPQVIHDYDGEDVTLGESGRVLKTAEFPHLKELKGRTRQYRRFSPRIWNMARSVSASLRMRRSQEGLSILMWSSSGLYMHTR